MLRNFKCAMNLWVCAMASDSCGYCALMPSDSVATFGLLEMNKRVQLFFSWWLCVIAAWIYLLCAGNVPGIGPVLRFLSHQDLAQQQPHPDKVYEKGCERSKILPERAIPSHQNTLSGKNSWPLSVRSPIWLGFSKPVSLAYIFQWGC